jgi:Ca2+-binding EF-hand superfamily protein
VLGIGKKISNQVWEEVVKEVDENGDGEISYEEFERMMKKFLQ